MKIAVLLGGTSAERNVSIASGINIARALKNRGHKIVPIDSAGILKEIKIDNRFIVGESPMEENAIGNLDKRYLSDRLTAISEDGVDLIFIGLHGGIGENGIMQAMLDYYGFTYTGSGVLASAAAMDKNFAKMIFEANHIPTPRWFTLQKENHPDEKSIISNIENSFGFPLVIKPNSQGSTVGLSIVNSPDDVGDASDNAFQYDSKIIVEEYIPGRELTVSIVADYDLPIIEIIPEGGLYNYECKYTSGKSEYICPAKIPKEITEECKLLGKKAFKVLGCRNYGRVDFRLSPDNELFCLEVNTLPGMTPTSLVPKAARKIGVDFDELIETIAKIALEGKND